MVLEQTLYPSWSSIFDSFYEFHWIYKAKEWQFKTFLAKDEKFCLDAFTVSLYNRDDKILFICLQQYLEGRQKNKLYLTCSSSFLSPGLKHIFLISCNFHIYENVVARRHNFLTISNAIPQQYYYLHR